MLDVDVTHPYENKVACENITWTDTDKMEVGKYRFFVHQYCFRDGESGFRAEVEFGGLIYNYEYRKTLQQDEDVDVAYVTLENGVFTIEHSLECKEIRDKKTNKIIDPDSSSNIITLFLQQLQSTIVIIKENLLQFWKRLLNDEVHFDATANFDEKLKKTE